MDSVPAPNGSVVVQTRDMEQHYCYVDVNLLEFDVFTGYWRPQGSVGDRVTLQGPTLLTEHGDVTCLEVDKGKSLQETKHQMMIAWVQDVDEKAVKPEEWNSKLSHATKKSRKTDKRTPTNTWGNMTEEKVIAPTTQPPTNAVTLRPLSSMFCEKMDLSLSASVLESGMMPLNIGTDPDIAWTNRQQPHDLQQNSTFLTEEGNLGMEKAQLEINLNLPSETEDLENVRMEMWSTDNESKLYVGRIESVGQYKTDSEFSVQLQRETGTNMDNKTLLNEGYNSDVQQNETPYPEPHRVIANSQDKQNVLQSSVENIVEEQHMKKPTLATIRIPSFESNENETVHTMDPESQNPELSGATVNDDHVMCTSNRNVDNEDSDKEEAEIQTTGISTIIIGSTAVGEDVSLGDDESKLTGTENKSYQNSKQRSSKKTARRVQSARVPENVETKTSSLVTRPYSAVVTRPKHVVFGNNECDSDSRPGSASSFQLQRTEAWRSSASSGSAALGESAVQKTFDFSSFSARTQTNANTQKVKFSVGMHKPPPQRPTSPDQHNIESYRETSPIESSHEARSASQSGRSSVEPKSASKSLSLSRAFEPPKGSTLLASSWLAQGRDVHYEKQIHRRLITSPRLPGYLEGTSMMPPKPKKATETSFTPLKSETAVHLLPSRPTKVATKLSQSPLRRSFEGHNLPQSALGGSLVWSKPRFSALQELKKLTNKPGRPQKSHPSQNGFPRKTI
uniref:Uncharacterized protein LOC104265755 n=1 Tax=Phallusia mammillata TaxID=59560 RepID=A0A6F9DJM0_9ASCI|nr:uncharacterized protein LOC104265755 [Phallusia mammillata]